MAADRGRRARRLPTLRECERAMVRSHALPAREWAGRCYEVAVKLLDLSDTIDSPIEGRFRQGTRAVYGHYLGDRSPTGAFPYRPAPFEQHGWLVLPDGAIFDPTGWAFTSREPQIILALAGDPRYDEGGNRWREAIEAPPPAWDPEARVAALAIGEEPAREYVARLLGAPPSIALPQAMWLANLSRGRLGEHAPAVYRALLDAGLEAFIPIDNRRAVLGQ